MPSAVSGLGFRVYLDATSTLERDLSRSSLVRLWALQRVVEASRKGLGLRLPFGGQGVFEG